MTTNEPAFPITESNGANSGMPGMTLRDYFAAKAISQIIATCTHDTTHGMSKADYFAGRAYEMADAMLKARNSQ